MDGDLHWSIWLISGMALGTVAGIGESGVFGLLAGIGIICSPFLIYMKVGASFLPFLLFYGGLMAVSSILYKRRSARQNEKLHHEIEEKKKRFGR
ncbi:MAG: hypothetical protein A2045_10820 [Rhodocyclales bacterium GWA2_65_20]|nr:MAG: hypothetical protein A2045_10820 [Rhodocyclales bacterium GWA2_65_20]